MSRATNYDVLIIGSGPAGQKAAIQVAKAGSSAAIIEQERGMGGACVHRGTIPSKALRENALQLARGRQATDVFQLSLNREIQIPEMLRRMRSVIKAHDDYITDQLQRNDVSCIHGRASFVSEDMLEVTHVSGESAFLTASKIIIATGSRPREPDDIPIDHDHILDSDSILSLIYLPSSLTILGGGVIACEYATIFAVLGVRVTMIDKYPRPLGFLDSDLVDKFVESFEASDGRWIGNSEIASVRCDGVSSTAVTLEDGTVVESEKMLVALGRVANLETLNIDKAGLAPSSRGFLDVDEHCRTANPKIYGVGDVIGPPSLASTSMEQGRRAACHALGIESDSSWEITPMGIYTIPEMSTVGLTERQAIEKYGSPLIGRSAFNEVARGQISGIQDGLLKLVADAEGKRLLGVAIVGDGATELIHIGQMGLLSNCEIDTFVENIFNFPTLAEAYRVAALDIVGQRRKLEAPHPG